MSAMELYLWVIGVCLLMVAGPFVAIAIAELVKWAQTRIERRRRGRYMAAYWRAHERAGSIR